MQHLTASQRCCSTGTLTLRFGGTRKKMLVNWISHSSGRYRDPTFGHQKWTFFGFASKKWNHLARTTLTDFVTSRDVTEPIKPVRWRFGLRALALRGGSRDRSVKSFWLPESKSGEIASLFEAFKTTVRLGVNKKPGYRVKVEIQESTLQKFRKTSDHSM